jgi:hypothetical protein
MEKVFRVVVRDVSYIGYIVRAENEEQAMELVGDGEYDTDLKHYLDGGEWEILSATDLTEGE